MSFFYVNSDIKKNCLADNAHKNYITKRKTIRRKKKHDELHFI